MRNKECERDKGIMFPSNTSLVMNQATGLVEDQGRLMVAYHQMGFYSPAASSPLIPYGYPQSLGGALNTTTSSSSSHLREGLLPSMPPPVPDHDGHYGGQVVQRSSIHSWPWDDQEGSKRPSAGEEVQHSSRNKNNHHPSSSRTTTTNSNSLSIATIRMKKAKTRRKVREPRFCFKTMSDVDVLDDGYKWRKYGQKVVKNTQHPRSYYRCTQDNCRVKKKVERLAEDPRMVITTYEGRHSHSPSHDGEESQPQSHVNFFW